MTVSLFDDEKYESQRGLAIAQSGTAKMWHLTRKAQCVLHFADEQTEVQRWGVTGPRSQNESVVAPDLTQLNWRMATTVASRKLFHGKHKVRLAPGAPSPQKEEGAAGGPNFALQPAEIYIAHRRITAS